MSALFEIEVPAAQMQECAAALGSDVPFFLGSAAALVEGRGERLTPLRPRIDYGLAAVFPGVRVSTAEAFRELDELHPGPAQPLLSRPELLRAYGEDPPRAWGFANSFDEPVFTRNGQCDKARTALLRAGALAARLTGSGSTVIGIFADRAAAERCAGELAAVGHAACSLNPLATIPAVCYYK
jgi:4-diphosphocytidyl-2-C-methyl-D-erythritol kinase